MGNKDFEDKILKHVDHSIGFKDKVLKHFDVLWKGVYWLK